MNIEFKDELKSLFPKWRLNDREVVWLWLMLRRLKLALPLDEFGANNMCDRMAHFIEDERLIAYFEEERNITILREEDLQWIEKSARQSKWLIDEFLNEIRIDEPVYPAHLSPREKLIAIVDYWNAPIARKSEVLDSLRKDWGHHLEEDKYYKWFKENSEKQKCETAWGWYRKEMPRLTRGKNPFHTYEALLLFLDSSGLKLDEKRLHIVEIKKEWKRRQVSANQEGTKQTNFAFPEDVRSQLDTLAKKFGLTKKELVERLIRHAAKNGLPKISD
ncbi:hypothetical protein [Janthinobacterium sp.]|uniref:hypothetical protein n=1 Tax=Janthinobacterium sp. TaxID=1871054 RepID=UPI002899F102|nr:hypothetical protein [Janthinobacterium sp.]